jgi:hypothetical protein
MLALLIAPPTTAPTAAFAHSSDLSFNSRIDHDGRVDSCDDIEMEFRKDWGRDGIVTVRRSQTIALGADVKKALRLEAADRGGIRVQPALDGKFSALVCTAAGAESNGAGEKILDRLTVVNAGGVLRVDGPDTDDWAAIIVLSVPAGSTLDLESTNGPLQMGDVDGRFTVRTSNGPIKLSGVKGVVDARAENGPIKFRGHAGDVTLTAQNGPVDVEVDAAEWSGKRLDASTRNGPIKVSVPEDMKSGVEVTASRWSPTRLNGASPDWSEDGDGRHYHWGSDPTLIRVSTVNGPMKIFGPSTNTKAKTKSKPRGDEI